MKYKLLLCSALILSATSALTAANNKILDAMEELDVDEARHLLKKAGELKTLDKEELLRAVHRIVKEHREKTKSLFNSGWDLLKVVTGGSIGGSSTAGALVCLGFAASSTILDQEDVRKLSLLYAAGFGVSAGLGWWLFAKGWCMSTANGKLEKARKIERLIEETPVED